MQERKDEAVGELACRAATEQLEHGRSLIAASSWREAAEALSAGIAVLGGAYLGPSRLDDSGLKLAMALGSEAKGEIEIACRFFERVLESRIAQYGAAHAPAAS